MLFVCGAVVARFSRTGAATAAEMASTPRLPKLDPAAARSPRRGYIPTAEENPYIPHMRTRVGKAATPRPARALAATAPAAASGSQSARAALRRGPTDAELREMQYKRSERLHDSYQTALSRETLLSEQYDKELSQVKESLAKLQTKQPLARSADAEVGLMRQRGKLEKRCAGFESKLNELETYNQKLMDMINGLRKQNEPNRQARLRVAEHSKKLALDMAQQKQLCHKSLDERERCVDQLRHIREDSEHGALRPRVGRRHQPWGAPAACAPRRRPRFSPRVPTVACARSHRLRAPAPPLAHPAQHSRLLPSLSRSAPPPAGVRRGAPLQPPRPPPPRRQGELHADAGGAQEAE